MHDFMAQLREIKLDFECRFKTHIPVEYPIMERMVERVAVLVNRHLVGHDGKAPYERVRHRTLPVTQVELGEQTMAKVRSRSNAINRKNPFAKRIVEGTWLGVNEAIVDILVVLENGDLVGCETRFRPVDYLPAGAPVEFEISPDNVWAHVVRSAKPLQRSFKHIFYTSDFELKLSKGHKISREKTTLEFSFNSAVAGSIYTDLGGGKLNRHYSVYLKVEDKWEFAAKCEADGWQYLIQKPAAS